MDDSKKDTTKEFNWQNLKQFFADDFPFNPVKMDDLSSIEKYVDNAVTQFLPKPLQTQSKQMNYHVEMFETHKNVIVKFHLSEKEAKNVTVFVGVNRIMLEGFPDTPQKVIKLTTNVDPESCIAVYRNGILQLHIRKQVVDDYLQRVNVKFPK